MLLERKVPLVLLTLGSPKRRGFSFENQVVVATNPHLRKKVFWRRARLCVEVVLLGSPRRNIHTTAHGIGHLIGLYRVALVQPGYCGLLHLRSILEGLPARRYIGVSY